MPIVSAAHQFGLDLARGDQGGCRLTCVQLRDRQVEAEIANRLGIISLAGACKRPVELLYRLSRALHSQSRLAGVSMPFDDRIDRRGRLGLPAAAADQGKSEDDGIWESHHGRA
jgi:hypothetical protein